MSKHIMNLLHDKSGQFTPEPVLLLGIAGTLGVAIISFAGDTRLVVQVASDILQQIGHNLEQVSVSIGKALPH